MYQQVVHKYFGSHYANCCSSARSLYHTTYRLAIRAVCPIEYNKMRSSAHRARFSSKCKATRRRPEVLIRHTWLMLTKTVITSHKIVLYFEYRTVTGAPEANFGTNSACPYFSWQILAVLAPHEQRLIQWFLGFAKSWIVLRLWPCIFCVLVKRRYINISVVWLIAVDATNEDRCHLQG